MTTVETGLGAAELSAVACVLTDSGELVAGPLTAELISGGRSNLTFLLDDGRRRWVMRTPPRAGRTPSAHDVGREYRLTAALRHTAVPVARAVAFCGDEGLIGGPFAIADFVPGRTVQTREQLDEIDDHAAALVTEDLVSTLAALHLVDYVTVGLERFGRPDGYATRQLRRWAGQWETVGAEELHPLASQVVSRLGEAVPDQASTSIVHGDYRIDNAILEFDEAVPRIGAVVDWELSTIGDPIADVATMCAYRNPAFDLIVGVPSAWTSPRLPGVEALAAAYEAAGGVALEHWEFHLALAYFKIGVIAAGIDYRFQAGAVSGAGFDTSGQAVETYLELALASVGGRR